MKRSAACVILLLIASNLPQAPAVEFTVQQKRDRVTVCIDGELFTEYLVFSGRKPVLWPIIGPTGEPMTRAYPMEGAGEHEKSDHVHHRSLWFTHGDVNGIDFWLEQNPKDGDGFPITRHQEFVKATADGDHATIITGNDWLAPSGERVLEDERTLKFGADDEARWIDFTILLKASDGDVTFGDTKEGTFGVRVAGTMKIDAKQGGKVINSRGETDKHAWGQPAEWVDYQGPVAGKQVGIAIFSHPTNFRHPCRWHVRSYGLFTANPFGEHHFPPNEEMKQGAVTLKKGESLSLRYLVLFHRGDEREGQIVERFAAFADE